MIDTKQTGAIIKQARKDAGLSQIQLAEHLNVSREAVSKWENGHHLPDVAVMETLSAELGISIDKLLTGRQADTPSTESKAISKSTRNKLAITAALVVLLTAGAILILSQRVYVRYDADHMKISSEYVLAPGSSEKAGIIYLLNYDSNYIKWNSADKKAVSLKDNAGRVLVISLSIKRSELLSDKIDRECFYLIEYVRFSDSDPYDYVLYYPGSLSDIPDELNLEKLSGTAEKNGAVLIPTR